MKKFLIAGAALAAAVVATAAPASAAPYGSNNQYERTAFVNGRDINREQASIAQRIEMGQRTGAISFREATRLKASLREIDRLEWRYSRDGLSRWEVTDLDRRLDVLSRQVRFERHDRNDRRDTRDYRGRS
jgi:hypothetical protein